MTKLEEIFARMKGEPAFADAVFTDASRALADYCLPAEHMARLKAMSRAEFEALTSEIQTPQPMTANASQNIQ
jgi:hypothetical protein